MQSPRLAERFIAELIEDLGGPTRVAAFLAEFYRAEGRTLSKQAVSKWVAKNEIGVEWWRGLVAMAASLGVQGVDYDSLTQFHAGPEPVAAARVQ